MKVKFAPAIAGLAVVLMLPLAGFGQSTQEQDSKSSAKSGATDNSAKLSMSEKHFLKNAAEGNAAEVELGKLAQEKSQDSKVKDFAQRMVTDHTKANDELKSVASSKGVDLPTEPGTKAKLEQKRLSRLSGEQFDKAYMEYMVKEHQTDVKDFQKESQSAKDPDVKSFASTTLPKLQQHLKEAQSIVPKERAEAQSEKSKSKTSTSASNPPLL